MIQAAGNITAIGDGSMGIRATASGGSVTVSTVGDVTAIGTNGVAIYASSSSGVWITNEGGNIVGDSAGVKIDGGPGQIWNYGSIAALSGPAIATDLAHADVIHNFGTITGNIGLGAGDADDFNNHIGAVFNSGEVAFIGGTLTNRGTVSPGGTGEVLVTQLDGAFVQSVGTYAVDVAGSASDRLVITEAAQLAGLVDVNVVSLPTAATYTILAANSVSDNGLSLSASPALHAQLIYPGNDTVQLGVVVDFNVSGLNRNQTALAGGLNSIFSGGGGGAAPVLLGLLNATRVEDYMVALDQIVPSVYQSTQISAFYANAAFANALLSCRVNGPDTASIVREGQCLWAGATAQFVDSGTSFEQPGFNQTAGGFSTGAQFALDEVWRLGFAAGYQNTSLDTPTGATSEGDQAQVGAALKYNPGPLLLAAAVTGGWTWNDATRPMAFGGFTDIAGGSQRIDTISASARAAYVLGTPDLYFKPVLDGSVTRIAAGDVVEAAGNGAALVIDGAAQTVWAITPAVEVGTEWWFGNGTLVRPFVRGGATWYSGGEFALAASFIAAPDGVAPFTVVTNMDDMMGVVGAGVDVINADNATFRVTYDGQLGEATQIHSAGVKGSARF